MDYKQSITYDDANRIIKNTTIQDDDKDITATEYVYNNDNTITSTTINGNYKFIRTFELNSNGLIDKEITNGNVATSIVYDNLRPLTKTVGSTVYNYTYVEKGSLPFNGLAMFANNPINVVLFQNNLDDSSGSLSSDLISKITSDSSVKEYIYTFNKDNHLLTKTSYYNETLVDIINYYYE